MCYYPPTPRFLSRRARLDAFQRTHHPLLTSFDSAPTSPRRNRPQYRGIAFDVIGPFGFLHMLEGITFIGDALFGSTAVSASKEMKKASKSWDDVREAMARDSAQKEKSRRD